MTLPTNDDFAHCELSIEELEAIAAGGFWSTLKKVGHVADSIVGDIAKTFYVATVVYAGVIVAGAIFGGGGQRPTTYQN